MEGRDHSDITVILEVRLIKTWYHPKILHSEVLAVAMERNRYLPRYGKRERRPGTL